MTKGEGRLDDNWFGNNADIIERYDNHKNKTIHKCLTNYTYKCYMQGLGSLHDTI